MEVIQQHISFVFDSSSGGNSRSQSAPSIAASNYPTAAEMEGFMAAIQQEVDYVRQDKIWSGFHLKEADEMLSKIEAKYAPCFSAIIGLHKIELRLLNWIVSPNHSLLKEVIGMCDALLRKTSALIKEAKQFSNSEAHLVFTLELRIMRCELQMVAAFADFQKKNIMSAAHILLSVYNQYKKLSVQLRACEEKVFLKDQLNRFCDWSLRKSSELLSLDTIDPQLLATLSKLIDQKSKEIRQMHRDRRQAVNEAVLTATRDLLQLKQLYKDLAGRWRSSDGHTDCDVRPSPESSTEPPEAKEPVSPFVMVTPEKPKSRPTLLRPNDEEEQGENEEDDDLDKENDALYCLSPVPQPAQSPGPEMSPLAIRTSRRPVTTVKLMLPRLLDLTRFFESTPTVNVALKPNSEKFMTVPNRPKNQSTASTGATTARSASASANSSSSAPSAALEASHAGFCDVYEAEDILQRCRDGEGLPRATAQLRSRLLLASSLFSLGLAAVPENLAWVLAILNLRPDTARGLAGFYLLHKQEHSIWSPVATLLLLNLPPGLVEKSFEESARNRSIALPSSGAAQFRALVEAQSLLLPWTSSHPLWLASLSRISRRTSETSTSLPAQLDHMRRALRCERDLLPSLVGPEGCYWMRLNMTRHFIAIGHWMQAISAARDLLARAAGDPILVPAVTVSLLSAAAAMLVSDNFASQTTYLQLKFDDRIIFNDKSSFSLSQQQPSATRHQHLLQILVQSFAQLPTNTRVVQLPDNIYARAFLGTDFVLCQSTYAQRVRYYCQAHALLTAEHDRAFDVLATPELVMEEFLVHWCFLLPIEMVYLFPCNYGNESQAQHAQLLQIADKGVLLFTEKYMQTTRREWKAMVRAVIVGDLVNREVASLKQSLLQPSALVTLQQEHVLLTGSQSLRLLVDESTSPLPAAAPSTSGAHHGPTHRRHSVSSDNRSDLTSSLFWGPSPPATATHPSQNAVHTAEPCLRRVRTRCTRLVLTLHQKEKQYIAGFKIPAKSRQLFGDTLVTWLVVRGLMLKQMGRVWEAVMAFKLLLSMKESAPRTRWAVFIALYHLAEIVLSFDVCEGQRHPNAVAAEYLDLASVAVEESLANTAGATLYAADYLDAILELTSALQGR